MVKKTIILTVVIIFLANSVTMGRALAAGGTGMGEGTKRAIDHYVRRMMGSGKIPGVSVTVIKNGKTVYKKGYGYADIRTKQRISPDTEFEIASLTKAFTGLGVMLLVRKGKIHLNDPIGKFLPWFHPIYDGTPADITVKQLLEQDGGILSDTSAFFSPEKSSESLEQNLMSLRDVKLTAEPGKRFIYSNNNFNLLGLIIEKASGKNYVSFMKQEVLAPLHLKGTYFRTETIAKHLATGYKIGFFTVHNVFFSPVQAMAPSAEMTMNGNDMEKWMAFNLGFNRSPIRSTIDPSYDNHVHYFAGWMIQKPKSQFFHTGTMENFSSKIILEPKAENGIAVLANLNSAYTKSIADGIDDILHGKAPPLNPHTDDRYQNFDRVGSMVIIIAAAAIGMLSCLALWQIRKIIDEQKRYRNNVRSLMTIAVLLALFILACRCAYFIPEKAIAPEAHWAFVNDWYPFTLKNSVLASLCGLLLLIVNIALFMLFHTKTTSLFHR